MKFCTEIGENTTLEAGEAHSKSSDVVRLSDCPALVTGRACMGRECLDHVIVMNEAGLSPIVTQYLAYYHHSRTHLSLAKDSPQPRTIVWVSEDKPRNLTSTLFWTFGRILAPVMPFAKATAFAFVCFLVACSSRESRPFQPAVANSVAAFLMHAERQSETDDQRREIQHALRDMLDKSTAELRRTRYSDYSGQVGAWTVTELLMRYFVPNPPAALDDEHFFQDFRAAEAREAIQHQLDDVTRTLK
jgi:hypothetical protein